MGLPTGAEGKESGKGDESAEETEQKPVVVAPPPVVETVATPAAASPPSDQTPEVSGAENGVKPPPRWFRGCQTPPCYRSRGEKLDRRRFLAEREAAGTNSDQARQEPGDGAEREAARPEVRAHLGNGRQPRQMLRHGGGRRFGGVSLRFDIR